MLHCTNSGTQVNLDNFQELARVDEIVAKLGGYKSRAFACVGLNVGLRINPQVGVGSIKEFSTAGQVSKFGIPLAQPTSNKAAIYKVRITIPSQCQSSTLYQ